MALPAAVLPDDEKPPIQDVDDIKLEQLTLDEKLKPCHLEWWRNKETADEKQNTTHGARFWTSIPREQTEQEIFWTIEPGRGFCGYADLPVEVTGPPPNSYPEAKSFEAAGLHTRVVENVKRSKYEMLTPIQKHAIPIVLAGRDIAACAQTGSGKTAAYLLPIISKLLEMDCLPDGGNAEGLPAPLVLILVPTRELASQVYVDALRFSWKTNINVVRLYGDVNVGYDWLTDQVNRTGGCHMAVGTPGGVQWLLKNNENEPTAISLAKLQYLVFDEADHMVIERKSVIKSDNGETQSSFYHDVQQIVKGYDMPRKEHRQTLMFSATMSKKIQTYAMDFMNDRYLYLWVGKTDEGSTFKDIKQTVIAIDAKNKRNKLLEILEEEKNNRVIVFMRTKKRVKEMVEYLRKSKLNVAEIHRNKFQKERELALRAFRGFKDKPESFVPVIVATAVGSRGLDIEKVELVINFDIPDTEYSGIEEYIHKVGRTGRIGNSGRAITFFDTRCDRDVRYARTLVKALVDSEQDVPDWLDSLAFYAVGTKTHFNEKNVSTDIRYIGKK